METASRFIIWLFLATLMGIALAMCAGCAVSPPVGFEQAGKTEKDYLRDRYFCERDTETLMNTDPNAGNPFIIAPKARQHFLECMQFGKGYTLTRQR